VTIESERPDGGLRSGGSTWRRVAYPRSPGGITTTLARTKAPDTHPPEVHERMYSGALPEIGAVRADFRPLLTDCPAGDEVLLCISELAANAVLHSDSREPGGKFTVRTRIQPGIWVQVEVDDSGGAWSGLPDEAGRAHGLDIVRALAAESGVRVNPAGRTVWAQLSWLCSGRSR
jgi:serine/threonine-protein kinase RsbW